MDGVEMLLEILNAWKKRQPGSTDEEECVENVFDALCSALVRMPCGISSYWGALMQRRGCRASSHVQVVPTVCVRVRG